MLYEIFKKGLNYNFDLFLIYRYKEKNGIIMKFIKLFETWTKPTTSMEGSSSLGNSKEMQSLVDVLVNSMDLFISPEEFADSIMYDYQIPIDRETLLTIYNEYWNINPIERFEWNEEWYEWLSKFI